MMYRISICDDEPFFLKRLKEMTIAFFSDKEEVQLQTFHDPAFLLKHLPASDLFLLDVKMPEVSVYLNHSNIHRSVMSAKKIWTQNCPLLCQHL